MWPQAGGSMKIPCTHRAASLALRGWKRSPGAAQYRDCSSPELERDEWETWWNAISSGLCHTCHWFITARITKGPDMTSHHRDAVKGSRISPVLLVVLLPDLGENTIESQLLSGNFQSSLDQQLLKDNQPKSVLRDKSSLLIFVFKTHKLTPINTNFRQTLQSSFSSGQRREDPLVAVWAQLLFPEQPIVCSDSTGWTVLAGNQTVIHSQLNQVLLLRESVPLERAICSHLLLFSPLQKRGAGSWELILLEHTQKVDKNILTLIQSKPIPPCRSLCCFLPVYSGKKQCKGWKEESRKRKHTVALLGGSPSYCSRRWCWKPQCSATTTPSLPKQPMQFILQYFNFIKKRRITDVRFITISGIL